MSQSTISFFPFKISDNDGIIFLSNFFVWYILFSCRLTLTVQNIVTQISSLHGDSALAEQLLSRWTLEIEDGDEKATFRVYLLSTLVQDVCRGVFGPGTRLPESVSLFFIFFCE